MPEYFSNMIVLLALVIMIGIIIRFIVKAVRNKYAPIKSVKAVVIDKNKIESFSKYAGNGKRERYVVVFSAEGKKLSFYVSEFSYRGYRLKESGTLKYKGDRIIDFR